jgi:hypothetical protein
VCGDDDDDDDGDDDDDNDDDVSLLSLVSFGLCMEVMFMHLFFRASVTFFFDQKQSRAFRTASALYTTPSHWLVR